MKKIYIIIPLIVLIAVVAGCYTNVIGEEDNDTGGEDDTQIINIKGEIAGIEVGNGWELGTISDNNMLDGNNFSISVLSNDYPQLMYMCDQNGNIIMMARDFYSSEQPYRIDAQSTTIALVTTNPLLALIDKEHFGELVNLIVNSSKYPSLYAEVEKAIRNSQNILDPDNFSLLAALGNLMEDICGENISTSMLMTRAAISNGELLNIKDPRPFLVEINGNLMSITNTALSPAYKGKVAHSMLEMQNINVPTRDGYGGWELIQQSIHGWSSGAWGNLGNGDPVEFRFSEQGEYRFHFQRDEGDFYWHLIKDLFTELGIPKIEDALIKDVAKKIQLDGILLSEQTDPIDIITGIGGIAIGFLESDNFKNTTEGKEFYKRYANAGKHLEKAVAILKIWSGIKATSNALIRLGWKLNSPKEINFCLCYYDGSVSSCTKTSLVKAEHTDNQEGFGGQRLMLPIQVAVLSQTEERTPTESSYQKVKFEVISGGGRISERIVGTEESNIAGTEWTLGNTGIQQVKAVAIDMVTGQEISEPVIFNAKLREPADLTVRLDWYKLSGETDIDLHVVDPYGEEIYFDHMYSASGGMLDRDDVVGPGPEHIYWQKAPEGIYTMKVHYYDSESQAVTSYKVTIYANGTVYGPFSGLIKYDQEITVATIPVNYSNGNRSLTAAPSFVKKIEENKKYPKKK